MPAANPADFQPALLRIQDKPPAPLAGWMLRLLIGLLGGVALWAVFGQLDIVAVADGKLVPSSYLKIVQPAEQGIVKEILVAGRREGEARARCSSAWTRRCAQADVKSLAADVQTRRLALRRIEAQLAGRPLARASDDSPTHYAQAQAQYGGERARLRERARAGAEPAGEGAQ